MAENFESTSAEETVRFLEGQQVSKEGKKDRKKKNDENTAERSIHAHRTHKSAGWNRSFARGYDGIDWDN